MQVIGLDGRSHSWNLRGHQVELDDSLPRSELHLQARQLIHRLFPMQPILEEVPLPGTRRLRADFYVHSARMMIEVNGEQHYQFNPHHHGNRAGFLASLKRDTEKVEWCKRNNVRLVTLPYNEGVDEWKDRILAAETTPYGGGDRPIPGKEEATPGED